MNGNPRYNITILFDDGPRSWATSADHSFNYEVGNPGMRVGSLVVVRIGVRGTIVKMVAAGVTS